MRFALKLAYLGTGYHGFQTQPGVPTVEGKLMKALKDSGAVKKSSKARYSAAGRTDRGVHALCQVIAFDTDNPEASMPRELNKGLSEIWAYAWAQVDPNFNARTSAVEREYRYMLWGNGLELSKIKDASSIFLGKHDFRNFADEEKEESTFCDIRRISIQENGSWIFLDIAANRFVMHMVRKIAMGLKLVGKGEMDIERLRKMLDCTLNGRLEPLDARGLILKNVEYPGIKWNVDTHARDRALEEIHDLFMSHELTARILEEIVGGMR
ncbi:MAG: tRNA pseudouridine(38-40) synthase TruA [Candidatus Methanoperedens sp.]|nr:tRNA pseudouridine(38-40) synthase TruA [Candidatus Methanoperedens sp.]MCZ7371784.1 tRNA pseudouridine(38-40) synthase TruA [Candidatus Methanoperedens sp.]